MNQVRLSRKRLYGVRALIVLGTILLFVSVLSIWVNRLVLDTDNWVETSNELLEDEVIRDAVAVTLTDQLFSRVDVAEELRERLPPQAQALAAPAAAGLQQFTQRAASDLLARPRVADAWLVANRVAHRNFVLVVTGGSSSVSTTGGVVVLNLHPILVDIATRAGLGPDVVNRLPADSGRIVILTSDQLNTLESVLHVLDVLATWLWAVALAAFVAAGWLAGGRRRKTLRGIAYGLLFVGLAILVICRLGGHAVVDSLVRVPSNTEAAEHAFAILTASLKTTGWTLVAIGILMIVGTWLSGEGARATSIRRAVAPAFVHRMGIVWGAFAFLVLIVLLWGPIEATRNLIGAAVLIGLAALGLEAFRRETVKEFPDATFEGSFGDGLRAAFGRPRDRT
ncbi:MAG TPA: hypothetical protein VH306_07165 [Gaiellaceae bacterium]